jgi:hypothetical protein
MGWSPETGVRKINTTKGLTDYATGGARSAVWVTEKLRTLPSRNDGGCFDNRATGGESNNPDTLLIIKSETEILKKELVV